jgi:hypothetical protein
VPVPVTQPGAGSAGTATDRLAVTLRRIAAVPPDLAASAVVYFEEDDGTTTELRPPATPTEGVTDGEVTPGG